MSNPESTRVLIRLHVLAQILRFESAFDVSDVAIFDVEYDRRRDIHLEGQQHIADVDHDSSICASFVGPCRGESAWPMIPVSGFIGVSIFGECTKLAERHREVGSCL